MSGFEVSMRPAFSVIIPLRNKERYVRRALRSVLGQTWRDFELLVVDDASTDSSLEAVLEFEDPRLRVLRRAAAGPGGYAARNLGAGSARGDWLAFLDADDTWEETYLESMLALRREYPQSNVHCCGWKTVYANGSATPNEYYVRHLREGSHLFDVHGYLEATVQGCPPLWTSVVSVEKRLLLQAGGFPEGRCRRGGDIDTWLRLMLCGGTAAWMPILGATYYRGTANSVTSSTPHDIHGNCVNHTVAVSLKQVADRKLRKRLKRFSNHYQWMRLWPLVLDGTIRPKDMGTIYFSVSPARFEVSFLAALLPAGLVRRMVSLGRAIRRVIRQGRGALCRRVRGREAGRRSTGGAR